jgi:hypothetical protein
MLESVLFSLALLQVPQTPAQLPPSPISRIVVTPAEPTVEAQDTLRLSAVAEDARGVPLTNALVRFVPAGGRFEATVGEDGLFTSGATGKVPVTVVATVPGTRPVVETFEVTMVPAPAAGIDILQAVDTLLVGQSAPLHARSFSRHGDVRADRIAWRSSAPAIVRVGPDGLMHAVAAGSATVTAVAGAASADLRVTVLGDDVASFSLSPERADARTGDVVRFRVDARDSGGRPIAGLTPVWTFAPGNGVVDQEGRFVGYDRGR